MSCFKSHLVERMFLVLLRSQGEDGLQSHVPKTSITTTNTINAARPLSNHRNDLRETFFFSIHVHFHTSRFALCVMNATTYNLYLCDYSGIIR